MYTDQNVPLQDILSEIMETEGQLIRHLFTILKALRVH